MHTRQMCVCRCTFKVHALVHLRITRNAAPSGMWYACSSAALICMFCCLLSVVGEELLAVYLMLFRDTRGVLIGCVYCLCCHHWSVTVIFV